VAFALMAGTGIEYFVFGTYYSLAFNIILFFFLFLWWTSLPLKANEAVIEKTVHELMDEKVAMDAKAAGTEIVKSFVYYDLKGTYAIVTGICFLVLLKNDDVWEYSIEYHKPEEKTEGYFECNNNYIVTEKQEHLRAIRPRSWHGIELSDKTKLRCKIFAILFIGGVAFAGLYWLILGLKWWTLLLLGGYYVLYKSTEWIAELLPGNFMAAFKRVVSLPVLILGVLITFVQPFITIFGTYFIIAVFAFGGPALVLVGVGFMGWIDLKPETIAFIVIALGSVLSSTYAVTKWIIKHSPLKNWGNHEYESHREQLALYLAHPSNMVFLVYLTYFLILAVSGFILIQYNRYLISESFDVSILKAFLVYIAYTNMATKAKSTEIEAKVLLKRMSGLFVHDKI